METFLLLVRHVPAAFAVLFGSCSYAASSRRGQIHRFFCLSYRDTPLSRPSGMFGKGSCYAFLRSLSTLFLGDIKTVPKIPLTSSLISICSVIDWSMG